MTVTCHPHVLSWSSTPSHTSSLPSFICTMASLQSSRTLGGDLPPAKRRKTGQPDAQRIRYLGKTTRSTTYHGFNPLQTARLVAETVPLTLKQEHFNDALCEFLLYGQIAVSSASSDMSQTIASAQPMWREMKQQILHVFSSRRALCLTPFHAAKVLYLVQNDASVARSSDLHPLAPILGALELSKRFVPCMVKDVLDKYFDALQRSDDELGVTNQMVTIEDFTNFITEADWDALSTLNMYISSPHMDVASIFSAFNGAIFDKFPPDSNTINSRSLRYFLSKAELFCKSEVDIALRRMWILQSCLLVLLALEDSEHIEWPTQDMMHPHYPFEFISAEKLERQLERHRDDQPSAESFQQSLFELAPHEFLATIVDATKELNRSFPVPSVQQQKHVTFKAPETDVDEPKQPVCDELDFSEPMDTSADEPQPRPQVKTEQPVTIPEKSVTVESASSQPEPPAPEQRVTRARLGVTKPVNRLNPSPPSTNSTRANRLSMACMNPTKQSDVHKLNSETSVLIDEIAPKLLRGCEVSDIQLPQPPHSTRKPHSFLLRLLTPNQTRICLFARLPHVNCTTNTPLIDNIKSRLGLLSAKSREWLDEHDRKWVVGADVGRGGPYATVVSNESRIQSVDRHRTGCTPLGLLMNSEFKQVCDPDLFFSELAQILVWRNMMLFSNTSLANILWVESAKRLFSVEESRFTDTQRMSTLSDQYPDIPLLGLFARDPAKHIIDVISRNQHLIASKMQTTSEKYKKTLTELLEDRQQEDDRVACELIERCLENINLVDNVIAFALMSPQPDTDSLEL